MKSVILITNNLAPYRAALYDALSLKLKKNYLSLEIICGFQETRLHKWSNTEISTKNILTQFIKQYKVLNKSLESPSPIRLSKMLKTLNPSKIWIHEFSPLCFYSAFWAKLNKRKLIVSTEIGPEYKPCFDYKKLSSLQRLNHKIILAISDGIIACTPDALARAASYQKKWIFSPHCIDTELFKPSFLSKKLDHLRFIQVASHIPRKGGEYLLDAFQRASKKTPNISLTLIGGGDYQHLLNKAALLGIEDKINFHSFKDTKSILKEYQASDVFVFSTLADTFGVVVHEAAACGLPLLVSNRAGASEIFIRQNETGLLFNPYDPDELADKIVLLSTNSAMRQRLGQNARYFAEKYCVRKNAVELAHWINSI